jgi:hypothetical protein
VAQTQEPHFVSLEDADEEAQAKRSRVRHPRRRTRSSSMTRASTMPPSSKSARTPMSARSSATR